MEKKRQVMEELSFEINSLKIHDISRLAKLWIPLEKRVTLQGLHSNGEVIPEEPRRTTKLGREWQHIFDAKEFPEAMARDFLNNLGDIGGYSGVREPTPFDYLDFLNRPLRESKPGPDGIPYEAWAATGALGVETLSQADSEMRCGSEPPLIFNESGVSFLSKGSSSSDALEIIREAKTTRPISTKNTDNKIIVGVNVRVLTPRYQQNTHKCQRGFCGGRNFLTNVVALDAAGRIFL